MSAIDNARAALTSMERIGGEGWCLCVSSSAQSDVENALRALIAEHARLTAAAQEVVDLIGNHRGNLHGAALDAWRILTDAMRPDHTDGCQ